MEEEEEEEEVVVVLIRDLSRTEEMAPPFCRS